MTHLQIPTSTTNVYCHTKLNGTWGTSTLDLDKVDCMRCLKERVLALELQLKRKQFAVDNKTYEVPTS